MDGVFVVGCGDIGLRVARRCRNRDLTVAGLVRRVAAASELRAQGIEPYVVDLDAPGDLSDLPLAQRVLFYFAPPPAQGGDDPRLRAFLAAIKTNALPARIVYISTSAVYGDCGGAWIDEDHPVAPTNARGRRRLAAEEALIQWSSRTRVPVVILRVPGIYAADRLPEARIRQGLPMLRAEDCPYTNRIHADDLADICIAAAERGRPGAVYHASDGHPSTMADYFTQVAEYLDLPPPPTVDLATAREQLSASMLSFLSDSKRLKNKRILDELGVRLRYPDVSVGLAKKNA